jgi:hypothetical protein
MADPQKPLKTTGLAMNGQAITSDKFDKTTPLPQPKDVTIVSAYEKYQPSPDIDYSDLAKVNSELISLRIRSNHIRMELKEAERMALKAKYIYESQKKRVMISLSGGSAGEREAMAELLCEEAYGNFLVTTMVAKEVTQHNRDLRTDLETLREISNNLRRLIDL